MTNATIEERLLARRVVTQAGCWEFAGCRNSCGYGMLAVERVPRRAHRLMWEVVNGPIPKGLYVLHRCDNPPCFNPDHLFAGTPLDNMQDKVSKGRHRYGNAQVLKTQCPQGHPYDRANTHVNPDGHRSCRACARHRAASRRAATS